MAKKEVKSKKISKDLLEMIQSGFYPPGSKLPKEAELCEKYGVSRVPVREALSMLRAAGIISSIQGGGSYVEENPSELTLSPLQINHTDINNIKYLFEMRKILEPEAAYLAAQRRTDEHLDKLEQLIYNMKFAEENGIEVSVKEDIDFHQVIIESTKNPVFIDIFNNLSSLYENVLSITLTPNSTIETRRKAATNEHLNIYLAIKNEEPELAQIQCKIHLRTAEKKLSLLLKGYN